MDPKHRLIEPIIKYHCQTLKLTKKLKQIYSEIIFIEFTIVCMEICSLVFRVTRPNDSAGEVAYKCLFFTAVAVQLYIYCYNGQRLEDESSQIASVIYSTFDWSNLCSDYKKLLLLAMLRSQKSVIIKCAFFKLDLSLYLWVFKTTWSLIAALKTMHEKGS
ncbi:odorant receptor 45a-like [Lucilia sericata]|uniref:odorant receptor 45a-like n=1 Tax=Lucilia sericata TaxID=13632 RepID=UPI0018A848D0|nr:odorant receptor 45a-like [Lucilia sericata]